MGMRILLALIGMLSTVFSWAEFDGPCPSCVGDGIFEGTADELVVRANGFAAGWPKNGVWQGRRLILSYDDYESCNVSTNITAWYDDDGCLMREFVLYREMRSSMHIEHDGDHDFKTEDEYVDDQYHLRYYADTGLMTNECLSSVHTSHTFKVYYDLTNICALTECSFAVDWDEETGITSRGNERETGLYNSFGMLTNRTRISTEERSNGQGNSYTLVENIFYDEFGRDMSNVAHTVWRYMGYADLKDQIIESDWCNVQTYGDFGLQESHSVGTDRYGDDSTSVDRSDDAGGYDERGRLTSGLASRIVTNRLGVVSGFRNLYQYEYEDSLSGDIRKVCEELHTLKEGRDYVMDNEIWYDGSDIDHVVCHAYETAIWADASKCVRASSHFPAVVRADSRTNAIDKVLVEYALPTFEDGIPVVDCAEYGSYWSIGAEPIDNGSWRVEISLNADKVKLEDSVSSLVAQLPNVAAGASEVDVAACPGLYYSLLFTDDLSTPMIESQRFLSLGYEVKIELSDQKSKFFRIHISESNGK